MPQRCFPLYFLARTNFARAVPSSTLLQICVQQRLTIPDALGRAYKRNTAGAKREHNRDHVTGRVMQSICTARSFLPVVWPTTNAADSRAKAWRSPGSLLVSSVSFPVTRGGY